jgi:hypothetical protein
MTQKVVAFVVTLSFIAGLTTSATGAQSPPQALSGSICSTQDLNNIIAVYNFDSPTYNQAQAALPPGVKTYLAKLLTSRLKACAALAGPSVTACTVDKSETQAYDLWQHLKFCEGVLGFRSWWPGEEQPLVAAQEPTFYVLLSIGAGPPGSAPSTAGKTSTQSSSTAGKGGSGPASGSTATGSVVDNPAYFLLFIVAQRLQNEICSRSNINPLECDARHPVAVVPETTWDLEDFRTQCLDDPYVPNDSTNPYGIGLSAPAGHGTLGAIVINGSTVAVDGTFAIFTVYGSSEANFTGQVVDCSSGAGPSLSAVWSDNVSGSNKTTAISFFPLALAGTLLASNALAHEVATPAPSAKATPNPNAVSTFVTYQNDVALGTFAGNTSSLTLGNPSSGQTFRHSFESWTDTFVKGFNKFCGLQQSPILACEALKIPKQS